MTTVCIVRLSPSAMLWLANRSVEQGLDASQMSLQSAKMRGDSGVLWDSPLIDTSVLQLPESQIGPRQDGKGDHDSGDILDLGSSRMISRVYI